MRRMRYTLIVVGLATLCGCGRGSHPRKQAVAPRIPAGIITTVAGKAPSPRSLVRLPPLPVGTIATDTELFGADGLAVKPDGTLYIASNGWNAVFALSLSGKLWPIAGNSQPRSVGERVSSIGDGYLATKAVVERPRSIALGPDGSLYIADGGNRIRKLDRDAIITSVATDQGTSIEPALCYVCGIAVASDGTLIVADRNCNRVCKISPSGVVTTIAGIAYAPTRYRQLTPGAFSGDGGPASQAQLNGPEGVALGPDGSIYIADTRNDRIRRIDHNGIITTVAGGGSPPDGVGDGVSAVKASLYAPQAVIVTSDGTLFIADSGIHRVRKVDRKGIITTVAGTGVQGYSGDGGPATKARLDYPKALAIGPDGSLYIADDFGGRIRKVTGVVPAKS